MISFLRLYIFFSSAGCVNHARSNKSHSDLPGKGNALINLGTNESVCRTYPILGLTRSGFLHQSIHYIPTENQL